MRCYFMRGGHIFGVEELPNLSDSAAVEKAMALFRLRGDEAEWSCGTAAASSCAIRRTRLMGRGPLGSPPGVRLLRREGQGRSETAAARGGCLRYLDSEFA